MAQSPVLRIDIASIPDFRREDLAKGALALTEQVFSMPGAEERYQTLFPEKTSSCLELGRDDVFYRP